MENVEGVKTYFCILLNFGIPSENFPVGKKIFFYITQLQDCNVIAF